MIYYNKTINRKRYVPRECPRGHRVEELPTDHTLDDLLKFVYSSPKIIKIRHKKFNLDSWALYCPLCEVFERFTDDSIFMEMIKRDRRDSVTFSYGKF